MASPADIDRLIDEGLNRYGTGDLDGALHVWEKALAIDPDNPQVNSYVDYVRQNYEVLHNDSGLGVSNDTAPFGIEDEPEYIIEISHGEIGTGDAPMYMDPLDEGWFITEEQTHELMARTRSGGRVEPPLIEVRTISADLPPKHFEIEADEPPSRELALPPPPDKEVNFDSATREYGADERAVTRSDTRQDLRGGGNDFLDEPSSFRPESTPLGFGTQETEIKKRELGFVQPTQGPARLEVRLRTPSSPPPPLALAPSGPAASAPGGGDLELGGAGRGGAEGNEPPEDLAKTSRGMAPIVRSPGPSQPPPSLSPRPPTEEDLIASLPSPRRLTPLRGSGAPLPDPSARIPTRELPEKTRPPAPTPSDRAETTQGNLDDDDIALPSAATRELGTRDLGLRALGLSLDPLDGDTTREGVSPGGPISGPIGGNDFAISAPTRDLGLRSDLAATLPAAPVAGGVGTVPAKRPPSVYPDEDAPTRQSDARQIREEHSTQRLKALKKQPAGGAPDGTRQDIVLPFDPIDARTAQILDTIEPPGSEPVGEPKEDRTRRRITALIERSTAWSNGGELDKAVAAVDLALSEDPNSALAQKLIHRNRDAIMTIFQNFLGDLERQPQLARPLHELGTAPISPRAAFLLSRIDGTLTIDEILDVSGMPRLEAYRHLCQLFLRGILR